MRRFLFGVNGRRYGAEVAPERPQFGRVGSKICFCCGNSNSTGNNNLKIMRTSCFDFVRCVDAESKIFLYATTAVEAAILK